MPDHLRKLARAMVKDKDDTWARTTRKMDEKDIRILRLLVEKIDLGSSPGKDGIKRIGSGLGDSTGGDGWPDMEALDMPLSQNSDAASVDSSGWPKLLNESDARDPWRNKSRF